MEKNEDPIIFKTILIKLTAEYCQFVVILDHYQCIDTVLVTMVMLISRNEINYRKYELKRK